MSYLNPIKSRYSRYINYLKNSLEGCRPNIPKNPVSREKHLINFLGRTVDVLPREVGCRAALLADRCTRLACSIVTLLASLPSPLLNRLLPQNYRLPELYPSWLKFCVQARFFLAEMFESVGVVVCNAFLLLSDLTGIISPHVGFQFSKSLLSTQVQIEKIADAISGDKMIVDHFEKRRRVLREARAVIHSEKSYTEDEVIAFVEKAIEFDKIFFETRKRRISRRTTNHGLIESRFNQMREIIESQIDSIAIPKFRQRLESLGVQPTDQSSQGVPFEELIELQTQIDTQIAHLHRLHDPNNGIRYAMEKVRESSLNNFTLCLHNYAQSPTGSIVDFSKKFNEHFFTFYRDWAEIEQLYSYEMGLPQDVKADFLTPILEKIDACQRELDSAASSWNQSNFRNYDGMSPATARSILGVDSRADFPKIKAAYRRLILIHHPDKGGNEDRFKIIQKSYEQLQAAAYPES